MRRLILWVVVVVAALAVAFFVLDRTFLLVPVGPSFASDAPTIAPCNGHVLAEGVTYHFRDPRRGEMVAFHASGNVDGEITPDANARNLVVVRRVVGVPGDQVVGQKGRVYVNGFKVDDIRTAPFRKVELSGNEYFVLGDNRSFSQDSRNFGPVQRNAIFGRVFLVWWPLSDFGGLPSRRAGAPPGSITC